MSVPNGTFTNTVGESKDSMKDSNEYRYVMYMKSEFDRKLFPNDFDSWTVQEQYAWINENIATFYRNVPKSLLNLIPASFYPDCGRSAVEIPEWLDMDKYRRGQKFVHENYLSIVFTAELGLIHLYTFHSILNVLMFTKRTRTPYLAKQRYFSVLQKVYSWYDGEPWIEGTPAYKDMQIARKMHLKVQAKMDELDNEQIDRESRIAKPWCPDRELLLKDFAVVYPLEKDGQRPYISIDKSPYKPKGVSNTDIANTQCCLIGTILLCPQNYGVHNATDEDFDGFCHLWRCYGYYLGIEDENNFCRGSFEEIKQRTRDLYQYWVLPNLKDVTPEWEHIHRCIMEAFGYYPFLYLPYKIMILFAMDALNVSMPHLYASLSWAEWIAYKSYRFLFRNILKFAIFRAVAAKAIKKMIDQMSQLSPEKNAELQKRSKETLSNYTTMHY